MRQPTGIALFCVSALVAATWTGAAEAKRVFYEVNGHRYWYNSAKHSGPPGRHGRSRSKAAETAGKSLEKGKIAAISAVRTDTAPAAAPVPTTSPTETRTVAQARTLRGRGLSRRAQRRLDRLQAKQDARRRSVEAKAAALAGKSAVAKPAHAISPAPSVPTPPVETPAPAKAAKEVASASALPSNLVPPPPGPVLINTVTYDFGRGVKTTSLRDGTVFVENFDPQAFFRIVPDLGPTSTSSIVVPPTLADARKP